MEIDLKTQVDKQIKNPDWDKIKKLVAEKRKQFAGILSEQGATLISIKELYPEFQQVTMRSTGTEIKGRLVNKTKPRFVDTKKVKQQPIRDVYIATEDMGVLSATLWGKSRVELFKDINHNDAIVLKDVKLSTREDEAVIQFFDQSTVEKISDKDVKPLNRMLESIEMDSVKNSKIGIISGLVLSKSDREYKSCPICGKGLSELEDAYHCPVHREVKPENKTAVEVTLDTGKGLITTVLWPELLQGNDLPEQLGKIKLMCRVYDGNFYAREKAAKDTGATRDVLDKQFPKEMRLTCYSYETEKLKPQQSKTAKQKVYDEETVSVDDL